MKLLVLGAGLVGGPIAVDLAKDEGVSVTAVDRDRAALDRLSTFGSVGIRSLEADLTDGERVKRLAEDADLVINAVPGAIGFSTLRAVLDASRSAVDIAFFPEDPFELDELARRRGVVAIVDAGVAPGLSHMLTGHAYSELDRTDSIRIDVGGLPVERAWPYEYKAVFSPRDVIAEYTRPARLVERGAQVVRAALTDPERVDFPGVGTLEAFNSDGLRTLLRTLDVPEMKEKTLRYPGHAEKMQLLRDTGFFSDDEIQVAGLRIRPIDLTARLLAASWRLREGEADLTAMRVVVDGCHAGEPQRHTYTLLDRSDAATGVHSMARTTGYTATALVRLLASGWRAEAGIVAPETVGRDPYAMQFVLDRLAERGVTVHERVDRTAGLPRSVPGAVRFGSCEAFE